MATDQEAGSRRPPSDVHVHEVPSKGPLSLSTVQMGSLGGCPLLRTA